MRRRSFITVVLLFCMQIGLHGESVRADDTVVVAGYLPFYRARSWSPEDVGPITDLILFAGKPGEDGSLDTSEIPPLLHEKAEEARKQSGCRLLFCVGGWERSNHFAAVVADDEKRARFVAALADYCELHKLDGIDFDWEYPRGEQQMADFHKLLRETKQALAPAKRIVTVAQSPWIDIGKPAYETVDRIHVMSYDHAFPHATMEKSRADVAKMKEYGCPAEKIVLGVPFYGKDKDSRAKSYAQLVAGDVADDVDLVDGYAFNNHATVLAKLKFAEQAGLAGIMIWELGQEAAGEKSLLQAIESARE